MDDASDVHGWVSDAAKVLDIEERRALNAVCETLRDSNVEAVQLKVLFSWCEKDSFDKSLCFSQVLTFEKFGLKKTLQSTGGFLKKMQDDSDDSIEKK